jgi:hypothetical protein
MNTSGNASTGEHELEPEDVAVAEAEAEAIEDNSSAGDGEPPTDLRANTTTEPPATRTTNQ